MDDANTVVVRETVKVGWAPIGEAMVFSHGAYIDHHSARVIQADYDYSEALALAWLAEEAA